MRLWFKIALLNTVVVIILGIMLGLAIREVVVNSLRAEITKKGESLARNLSNSLANFILLEDHYEIQEAIEEVKNTEEDVEYIFVTGKEGEVIAHTFGKGYPPDILEWNPISKERKFSIQLLSTEKGLIRDIGIKVFEGLKAEVHLGISEDRITLTLNRIRNTVIALTAFSILIGALLSFIISRFVTKPLYKLINFIHELRPQGFGKKIEIKTGDEIEELSETFNKLSLELKEYKEKIEESYRQMLVTEKLTALGRLSAGLAHEIRNPLTSIKVLFQTLRENPEITKKDIEVVLIAVDQMEELLSRFLRFAKDAHLTISEVYINSLLKHILKLIDYQLRKKEITVLLDLMKLPPVKGDSSMLQQCLLNIILNAIDAMPRGGTLSITTKKDQNHIVISIADTGSGIPEEIKNKIFDPFFTTKPDGTGLGLSIAYSIIKLHNGEINFESSEKGTTFYLKLPIYYA